MAIGPRTVTNCLRALGLAEHPSFTAFHRVLNRNVWSGFALGRTLLRLLVPAFEPGRPFVVIGVDHTLERRRGRRIKPASQFHDAVRSTGKNEVTSRGLRWISAMLLVKVPFAGRIWGLPVLTALTPSKDWCEHHKQRYRPVTQWAERLLLTLHRWRPDRVIVAVMDGEFAAIDLLHRLRRYMVVITRLRLDACLFDPPSEYKGRGRYPKKGARQPSLKARITDPATVWKRAVQASRTSWRTGGWIEYASGTALWYHSGKPPLPIRWVLVRYPDKRHDTEAFLCTDTQMGPVDVLDCYNRRWSMETTYEEARPSPGHSTRLCLAEPLPVSPISASRPSASGRTRRSSAPRRCCSACIRWSPSTSSRTPSGWHCRRAGPPGIPNRRPPSPMLWRVCASMSGSSVSPRRPVPPI
ncbi:MAG TPA: transposase [Acetobacteraceae bacterium]|nr:transposase [Acetobacteraceae bacterium]